MYLDITEKDPDKNRRNGLIIFVICVILLGTLVKCAGQTCVKRFHPNVKPDSSRIVGCFVLNFGVSRIVDEQEIQEVIRMGVLADSVSVNSYSPVIFVWFPKSNDVDSPQLGFGFNKLGIETINPSFVSKEAHYAEFRLTRSQFLLLRENKYEYVNFRVDGTDLSYSEDWVEDPYISDFLKMF